LVGLLDVYRAFILIAHADRQTTSQGSELRPYNWDISVEGERWQAQEMGGVIIKFALVVDRIRQVALLGSI
jgi:hypothetical protein